MNGTANRPSTDAAMGRVKQPFWIMAALIAAFAAGALSMAVIGRPPVQIAAGPAKRGEPIGTTFFGTAVDAAAGQAAKRTAPVAAAETGKYQPLNFEMLSTFTLTLTNELTDPVKHTSALKLAGHIPAYVLSLDKREVALKGFMLPVKLVDGQVTEFILLKSRSMCCFGIPPGINEWVSVQMNGRRVKAIMDQPVTIYGTFHVAETHGNNGFFLAGLYQLDGDRMEVLEN
jgi:hypothetical protein